MNTFSRLTLATALLATPACKTTNYSVAAGAPTYAADAHINIKPNKTGNADVTLKMEHLAPPKRIDKALAGYVAWVVIEGQDPIKLGNLEYKEQKRIGLLHATTPQKKFTLQVTLEKATNVQSPQGTVIISHAVKAKI